LQPFHLLLSCLPGLILPPVQSTPGPSGLYPTSAPAARSSHPLCRESQNTHLQPVHFILPRCPLCIDPQVSPAWIHFNFSYPTSASSAQSAQGPLGPSHQLSSSHPTRTPPAQCLGTPKLAPISAPAILLGCPECKACWDPLA